MSRRDRVQGGVTISWCRAQTSRRDSVRSVTLAVQLVERCVYRVGVMFSGRGSRVKGVCRARCNAGSDAGAARGGVPPRLEMDLRDPGSEAARNVQ